MQDKKNAYNRQEHCYFRMPTELFSIMLNFMMVYDSSTISGLLITLVEHIW